MATTKIVKTYSHLDKVAIENDCLQIAGWVVSDNAGPLENLKIFFAGKEFTEFELSKCLYSPDVQQVWPSLDSVENSRFEISLPLSQEEQEKIQHSILILVPYFKNGEGNCITYLAEITLRLPTQEEEDLLGLIGGKVNFYAAAIEFFSYFFQLGNLKPTDAVLDVGCGMGRMAYALAHYLQPTARYEGFDIVEDLIEWAKKNITSRLPNFNFRRVNIYNKMYNPKGDLQAAEFDFPYENESFDFVFLTSVFTHVPANEVRHYLDEIYRVLKPGGRCLCTVLLHNEEAANLIEAGKSSANLIYEFDEYFATSTDVPELFTGFKESLMLKWISDRNFTVEGKYYGNWCGRTDYTSYQDMLILRKD